jgi:hypothetical protein
MAIMRYDIEVERTVTVTATPQPRNSRHAVKSIGWRLIATLAITGLAVLVVLVIQGMAEDWRDASPSPARQSSAGPAVPPLPRHSSPMRHSSPAKKPGDRADLNRLIENAR